MAAINTVWKILSRSEKSDALVLFFLMIIGMLFELLGVGLIIPTVALLVNTDLGDSYPQFLPLLEFLGYKNYNYFVTGVMLTLVFVYVVKNSFLGYLAWRQTRFSHSVSARLSRNLFSIYLRLPYTFHLQRNSSELIRNTLGEVEIFSSAVSSLMMFITETMVVLGLFALLVTIEPVSTIIIMVVLGVAALGFNALVRSKVAKWGVSRQYHDGQKIKHLQQGLGGVKDVKILGRENNFLGVYNIHNIESANIGRKMFTLKQLPRLWLEVLAVIGLASLVIGMLWQGKDMTTVLPVLGLFAVAAFRTMPSVNRILVAIQGIRFDLPVINVLHGELQLGGLIPSDKDISNQKFSSEILLDKVCYQYESADSAALKDVSFSISHGDTVGFIGQSGSGKSTLIDIILGLLSPGSGEVVVDGHDIKNNIRSWQSQIGYVPQSIFLTDDTLRHNIAFGLPDDQIDDAAVQNAIVSAQLVDLIASLPEGVETKVGERGVRLSGGQCQRIGIARALYHDPGILVLDEATSSLDLETEAGIMRSIEALHGSKTIIIVAHRLSTVEKSAHIYRLEAGRIVDQGRPDELLHASR